MINTWFKNFLFNLKISSYNSNIDDFNHKSFVHDFLKNSFRAKLISVRVHFLRYLVQQW